MRAITHPGQAHLDEVLSAAYLIAKGLVTSIERREPTPDELDDPEVIVFDIGQRHCQADNNYDHHQLHRDAAPTCALSLLLQNYGDYDDWNTIFPWLAGIEEMDSKGPFVVSKRLGIGFGDLNPFISNPLAGYIISCFEEETHIDESFGFWDLLKSIGKGMISQVKTIRQLWHHFDATSIYEDVNGVYVNGVSVIIFDTTGPAGIESWLRSRGVECHCVVSNDDRGDGLALFRRNDDPRIDFSQCESMENVVFAHKNGFIAKLSNQDWEPVIRQSLVEPAA